MPGQFLTTAERERLNNFPQEIPKEDIYTFFTLTPSDLSQIPQTSANYNRLGFAIQLGALRYLGFCPDEITTAPSSVIVYTANQLGIDPPSLSTYAQRPQTRTDHLLKIQEYLGFRRASDYDLAKLSEWLLQRALEHDKPTLLLGIACQRLYSEKIVRPGLTTLERMVIQARQEAQEETYRQLDFLMSNDLKTFLDKILIKDENLGRTPLFWLRHGATANTPKNILEAIEKLDFLHGVGVDKWHLTSLNPNRQKFLAQIGRSATNQALQRMSEQRRYPILLAFLRQSLVDIIDELIELFDCCLWDTYTKAKRENQEFRLSLAKTTNEKLILFQQIGRILLDKTISDFHLRLTIYSKIPEEELRASIEECDQLIRPLDDQSSDYFASRYSDIREFAPKFLDALKFQSNKADDPLIKALELIKTLNATRKRKVPEDAPLAFISQSWLDYVLDEKDRIVRRYYELSALWELRGALRSGDIWVKNSRKYANPETYLIPKDKWPNIRPEALRMLGLPQN
jgi:TnpA family transposase